MRPLPWMLVFAALLPSCKTPTAVTPPAPSSTTVEAPAAPPPLLEPSVPWPCPQQADVDGDGEDDSVSRTDGAVSIVTKGEPLAIALPGPAITQVCLGDLDGDGNANVLVGVVRPTSKDGTFRQRLFVYRHAGNELRSHFLGTQAAGTLLHFGVADLDDDGRAEVIARERGDDEEATRVYGWKGFGFRERQELAGAAPPYRYHPAVLEQPGFGGKPSAHPSASSRASWTRGPATARNVEVRRGLTNIANRRSFGWLNGKARRHLQDNGFVVLRTQTPPQQFHSLYIQNQYDSIPSFVTADAALHLTHIVFDDVLQDVEETVMGPALARVVGGMRFQGELLRPRMTAGLRPALDRVLLRLHVAESLLTGTIDAVPKDQQIIVQRELDAIEARSATAGALGMSYEAFAVRGHYTKSEALGRYFRANLLLTTSTASDPREVSLMTALAVSDPLHLQLLGMLDGLTRSLVGPAASATPVDLVDKARSIFGENPSWADFDHDRAWFLPLPPSRSAEREPSVALLARRWPADNEVFADPARTSLPDPLELLAALGSKRAREHLLAASPPESMSARLDSYEKAFRSGRWGDPNAVGGRWLLALRWTLMPFPKGYPDFQRTDAWADHGLVTAASAWTELRRDTILHVQPAIVWAEGGDEDALPPGKAAYVEPIPELYHELAEVLRDVDEAMKRYTGSPAPYRLERSRTLLALFEAAARRELAGQPLTREQHLALQQSGEVLEETLAGGDTLRLDPVPVIADVAHLHDPNSGGRLSMLMAATGPLDVIVVAVPLGQRVVLARGAVSSFHHFESSEFLNDEQWRERLARGEAPPRPAWARSVDGSGGIRRTEPRE